MNLNYRIQSQFEGFFGPLQSSAFERTEPERQVDEFMRYTGVQFFDIRKKPHRTHLEHDWSTRNFERANSEFSLSSVASPQILERLKAQREQQRTREEKRKKREAEQQRWKVESTWLAENRHLYRGKWIALDYDKLLAASFIAKEVFDKVRGYVPTPLVVRIEDDELPFGGW